MGIVTKVMYAKHLTLCWFQAEAPVTLCPSLLFSLFGWATLPFSFPLAYEGHETLQVRITKIDISSSHDMLIIRKG